MTKTSTNNFYFPWLSEDQTYFIRVSGGFFKDYNYNPLGAVTVYAIRFFSINTNDYVHEAATITDGVNGKVMFRIPTLYNGQGSEAYNASKDHYIVIPGRGLKFSVGPYFVPIPNFGYTEGTTSSLQIVYEE